RDAANAATQMPSIRDFRTTNEVTLGATFDDNSSPVTILRTSLGTFAGGPVAQKSWPAQYGQTLPSGLIDGKHLMIPTAAHGPLYRCGTSISSASRAPRCSSTIPATRSPPRWTR